YQFSATDFQQTTYTALCGDQILQMEKASAVQVVVVDVPLTKIDPRVLKTADVIVVRDRLTFFWLKNQEIVSRPRILYGEPTVLTTAIRHAVALRTFERAQEARGVAKSPNRRAISYKKQLPKRIMIMLGKWARGGMEQVATDIALGLATYGT